MVQTSTCTAPTIGVLGGFRLSGEPRPPCRAVQRVLAYLAVRGGAVQRSTLRTALWPESDAGRASASLRSALWRLPRPAGRPLVDNDGEQLVLAPHVGVDLWRSTEHARRLRSDESGHEVTSSHQQFVEELLPDWTDEWLLIEQESYRQVRLHALERTSALLLRQGRHADALQAALLAVRGEPLRESAHRHAIAVHLAEGNPAEALRQFHACRRLLAVELGLPPSQSTRDLVAHLLGRPAGRSVHP